MRIYHPISDIFYSVEMFVSHISAKIYFFFPDNNVPAICTDCSPYSNRQLGVGEIKIYELGKGCYDRELFICRFRNYD